MGREELLCLVLSLNVVRRWCPLRILVVSPIHRERCKSYAAGLPDNTDDAGKLGYHATKAQLLSVPPYVLAAIMTILVGYVADRTQQRGLCNMGVSMIGVVGFAMLLSGASPRVQYAGTFLGAMGIYPSVPNTITWIANNTEGVYKRGIVIGFVNGWGNLNGIVSSNIYRQKNFPKYRPGHGVVLAYLMLFLWCGSALQYSLLKSENAKRRRGVRDRWVDGKTEKEIDDLGDKRCVITTAGEWISILLIRMQARVYLHSLGIRPAASPRRGDVLCIYFDCQKFFYYGSL